MKEVFRNKAKGFRVLLGSMGMSLVTAIAYTLFYASTRYMSWAAFGILLAGIVLSAVLILCKLHRFAPTVMLLSSFAALMFHVYYIYFFISSVVTGIQFSGFPPEFFINFALYLVTLVLSIMSVFMPVEEE